MPSRVRIVMAGKDVSGKDRGQLKVRVWRGEGRVAKAWASSASCAVTISSFARLVLLSCLYRLALFSAQFHFDLSRAYPRQSRLFTQHSSIDAIEGCDTMAGQADISSILAALGTSC